MKKNINNITKNQNKEEVWKSGIDPDHHLNGISHGLSGIIYALYKARDFNKNLNLDLMIEKAIQIGNNGIADKRIELFKDPMRHYSVHS